jgi:membrane protease subunit (stomatin/prohibitin family)
MEEIISKLFKEVFKIENNKLITDKDKAFEILQEINYSDYITPSVNCRAIISELRTFGDDGYKVIELLKALEYNLKKVKSEKEIRAIISRLLRVFFKVNKVKIKKTGEEVKILLEEDIEEDDIQDS